MKRDTTLQRSFQIQCRAFRLRHGAAHTITSDLTPLLVGLLLVRNIRLRGKPE